MKKLLCFCLSLLILSAVVAYAHNGRTDYKGGHYDSETSEYHYHHGYPAHDHINGECPYDFKDKSSSSGGSSSVSSSSVSVAPSSPKKRLTTKEICWIVFSVIYIFIGFVLFVRHKKSLDKTGCLFVIFLPAVYVASMIWFLFLPVTYFASAIAEERRQRKLLASSRTPKRTTLPMPVKKARNFEDEQLVQTPPVSSKPISQIYELYERNGTIIHLPKNGSKQFVNVSYKKSTLLHTATPLTTYEHFVLERQYQTYLQEKAYYEYLFDRSPEELAGVPEGVNPAMAFMSNEIWAIYYRNIITVMRYYGIKPKVKTIQLPPSQTEHKK